MSELNIDTFWEQLTDDWTIKHFVKSEFKRVVKEFATQTACPEMIAETVVRETFALHDITYDK